MTRRPRPGHETRQCLIAELTRSEHVDGDRGVWIAMPTMALRANAIRARWLAAQRPTGGDRE